MFWLFMLIIGATLQVTLALCLQKELAKSADRKHDNHREGIEQDNIHRHAKEKPRNSIESQGF